MTWKIDVSHGGEQQGPHNAHQSPQYLDEIALKPNPLTQREYLKLLTEVEKRWSQTWMEKAYSVIRRSQKHQAKILSKAKDDNPGKTMIKEGGCI